MSMTDIPELQTKGQAEEHAKAKERPGAARKDKNT
jgi:hypothetical protein